MAKVVFKDVRVRELPPDLTAGLDAASDDIVRVTVDAGRREELAKLRALSKAASAEARRRGLTEEKLAELHEGTAASGEGATSKVHTATFSIRLLR